MIIARELENDLAALALIDHGEQAFGGGARQGAALDGLVEQVYDGAPDPRTVRNPGKSAPRLTIDQRDHPVSIEHAQPVVHGIERCIELISKPGGIDPSVNG